MLHGRVQSRLVLEDRINQIQPFLLKCLFAGRFRRFFIFGGLRNGRCFFHRFLITKLFRWSNNRWFYNGLLTLLLIFRLIFRLTFRLIFQLIFSRLFRN